MKKAFCTLFIVSFLIIFTPFSSQAKNIIEGSWENVDRSEAIEFFNEGTVSINVGSSAHTGNYRFIAEDRIRFDIGGIRALAGPTVVKVLFSKNKNSLILIYPGNKVLKYRRTGAKYTGEYPAFYGIYARYKNGTIIELDKKNKYLTKWETTTKPIIWGNNLPFKDYVMGIPQVELDLSKVNKFYIYGNKRYEKNMNIYYFTNAKDYPGKFYNAYSTSPRVGSGSGKNKNTFINMGYTCGPADGMKMKFNNIIDFNYKDFPQLSKMNSMPSSTEVLYEFNYPVKETTDYKYCDMFRGKIAGGAGTKAPESKIKFYGWYYNDEFWTFIPSPQKSDLEKKKSLEALLLKKRKEKENKIREEKRKEKDRFIEIAKVLKKSFVSVKGGCFQRGAKSGYGQTPIHEVCVNDFQIGDHEVTQDEWTIVMGSNPSGMKDGGNHPVENVSWYDVQNFIIKLNNSAGTELRLPTEAEWEYAAREGGKKMRWAGTDNEKEVYDYAWRAGDGSPSGHKPIKTRKPNALGLYDMSGNVNEWCFDWYDSKYYKNSPRNNPKGPESGRGHVLRGGGYNDYGDVISHESGSKNWATGFRLAKSVN